MKSRKIRQNTKKRQIATICYFQFSLIGHIFMIDEQTGYQFVGNSIFYNCDLKKFTLHLHLSDKIPENSSKKGKKKQIATICYLYFGLMGSIFVLDQHTGYDF